MAMAMVNNNIPFAAADTFNSLLKDMFPDSKIAQGVRIRKDKDNMHCKRVA